MYVGIFCFISLLFFFLGTQGFWSFYRLHLLVYSGFRPMGLGFIEHFGMVLVLQDYNVFDQWV
jgi:hypothetical protein